jgi:sugar lactone lactonase YvrE
MTLLSSPQAHAAAGDLFASDAVANVIRVYSLDGSMRVFASGLNSPQGLAFDEFGNLYVADSGSGNIYRYTADGTRTTFASGLNQPTGIAFSHDELVVAENGGNQITRLDGSGIAASSASYTAPFGVTFDFPNTYITNTTSLIKVDGSNNQIVTPITGKPLDVAVDGDLTAFVSSTDGSITRVTDDAVPQVTAFAVGLMGPNGLAFRPKRYSDDEEGVGELFVAETQAGVISRFSNEGVRSVFATGGNPNFLSFERILPGKLLNLSTRLNVGLDDDVLIGGFIVTGPAPRQVLLRAVGPSLSNVDPPIPGALQDTVLDLHGPDGSVITNDDWRSTQETAIKATGIPPTDDRESAIIATLEPGAYTAIVHGKGTATGVALVEAYDLSQDDPGELANISTRGLVTSQDVMIGGFIIEPGESARVLVRALGPDLINAETPIKNFLKDPTLELHDSSGTLVSSNDNWADTAEGEITATGVAPANEKEAAILANLGGGNYTAIVRGASDGDSGVALVEIYHLP